MTANNEKTGMTRFAFITKTVNGFDVGHNPLADSKWFVGDVADDERYLHIDGVVRHGTLHEGKYSGYFKTVEEALQAARDYKWSTEAQSDYEMVLAALETLVPVMQNVMLHCGQYMPPADQAGRSAILAMCENVLNEQQAKRPRPEASADAE